MRTLYLPIFEPGTYHERSLANKHGLRDALAAHGPVLEWDYLANEPHTALDGLVHRIEQHQPDLVFTQLGGAEHFNGDALRALRGRYPHLQWANFNGDYWPDPLTAAPMLDVLRTFDIQLVVNASVLPLYAAAGVRAAFWAFGYETPLTPLPEVPAYDVVYLGNHYSDKRGMLYRRLRDLPYTVGIYGNGWAQSEGECTYDFAMGEALYRRAKLTVSDNQFPDAIGYLSNRPFQAMAAGCFVLQQRVEGLTGLTGLVDGDHLALFDALDDLPEAIDDWMNHDEERQRIAAQGQTFVLEHHSWKVRVDTLLEQLLKGVHS